MSSATATLIGLRLPDPPGQRRGRVALGIAVSLAVHLLMLSAWRVKVYQERSVEPVQPPRSIAVWLRPLLPEPVRKNEPAVAASKPSPAPKARQPRRVIAVPRRDDEAPAAHIVRQGEEPVPPATGDAPKYDHDAALRMARQIAAEPDPGGAARKPLQAESKLARSIAAAKRRDCKDGVPGGLLAPVLLMLDKKDHGCKW